MEVSSRVGTCIILLLFSVLHHAQHITLQSGRLSLPQCSGVAPVTWQCLGAKVHMQSWSPRRLLKCLALLTLWIGRTQINGVFGRALHSKDRSIFSYLLYFRIAFTESFSPLFCHYICLLYIFSVSKYTFSFPDACFKILIPVSKSSVWTLDININADVSLACALPPPPFSPERLRCDTGLHQNHPSS